MRHLFVPLISVLMVSIGCVAATQNENEWLNMAISSDLPKSMMLAHFSLPSGSKQVRDDIDASIKTREVEYTWHWVEKTIRSEFLNDLDKNRVECFSGFGKNKDDVVMASWTKEGYRFNIVDARFLAVLVRCPDGVAKSTVEIFKKVVCYDRHCNKDNLKVITEELSTAESKTAWGRISVDRGNARGWFEMPIEWHRDGNDIIFAFEKILKSPASKIPTKNPSLFIGGLSVKDERAFLRFETSNRMKVAEEYILKKASMRDDVTGQDKSKILTP